MTSEEVLRKFGLPASRRDRDEIRRMLEQETDRERRAEAGEEMLRTLCIQLFSLGVVDDALLIWEAKESSFNAACGLDVQFLCGAGLHATKDYFANSAAPSAAEALEYLRKCEKAGDFADWTPQKTLSDYRRYFGLS
jgi:hypothetical protein